MPEVEYDPAPILEALVRRGVDVALIGGLAGIARGSAYNTHDTDVAYSRSRVTVRVASLDHLIAMKEAAGRPKDLPHASEYRVLSDELRAPRDDER